jgi:hypothetical protein
MTERRAAGPRNWWSEGPPKWAFSTFGLLVATLHLVLAGFDVAKFGPLWEVAWPFYSTLLGIGTAGAVAFEAMNRRRAAIPPGVLPASELGKPSPPFPADVSGGV